MTTLRGVASTEDAFLHAIAEMPESYQECRATQHRMNVTEPFRIVDTRAEQGARPHMGNNVYAKRTLECDRCGMVRNDFYAITSRRGHTYLRRINATYTPPDGYATVGLGRITGNRGLVLGLALEASVQTVDIPGRGRPRKGVS